MQHIKTLAAAMSILIFAASCKKEEIQTSVPLPTISKKVIEIKNQTNGDFTKYSYDSQGKVVKAESATNSWNIEYLPSVIKVTRRKVSDNKLLGTDEYAIDALGRVTSSVTRSSAGMINYNYEYEYDAAGYMIRLKEIYASGEVYEDFVTNPAGNPVTIKNYYNGVLNDVTDYYYKTDIRSIGTGTALFSYYGIEGFAGKLHQGEIAEFKRYNSSGTLTAHRINNFSTDADGRVLKYTSTYPLSGIIHEWHVNYQ